MQINSNYQTLNSYTNFRAGKVRIFSDFDGTYCPFTHEEIIKPENKDIISNYCKNIKNFINRTGGEIKLHITTGRTFGEYRMFMEEMRKMKLHLHLPDTIICAGGLNEYVNYGSDSAFFEDKTFPYSYNFPCSDTIIKAEKTCNWKGDEILVNIRRLASHYALRFVSGDTESLLADENCQSLYSEGKLKPNDWKMLPKHTINGVTKLIPTSSQLVELAVGSKNSGKLKINLLFPPDYNLCKKRTNLYESYIDAIKNYLDENNVKYESQMQRQGKERFFRPSFTITPALAKNKTGKVYDTRNALYQVRLDNDLLIVAGDGKCDFRMLNPLEYISEEFINRCKEKSLYNKDFYDKTPDAMLSDMELIGQNEQTEYVQRLKEELESNGFMEELENMPLCSIIVKGKYFETLQRIKSCFAFNKKISDKIIVINKGELQQGIINAIKIYKEQNNIFASRMKKRLCKVL